MKKVILFLLVIIWSQTLLSVSVQMSDGLIYVGILSAKQKGNIYVSARNMLYELPLKEVVKIENNEINITEVIINTDDFSDITIEDNKYTLYKHGSNENEENDNANSKEVLLKRNDRKKYNSNSKEVLLNMNDREFAIYELGEKQKQAEMVSNKIDRVSNTMWTMWGVSIGIGILSALLINAN